MADYLCECPAPGWCERHRMRKNHALWMFCQTSEDYRRDFDTIAKMRGTEVAETPEMIPIPSPCVYLGQEVVAKNGTQCRALWTHPCEVFGQCTIGENTINLPCCRKKNGTMCLEYEDSATFWESPAESPNLIDPLEHAVKKYTWAVGITAAPRPEGDSRWIHVAKTRGWNPDTPCLQWTIDSLIAAGWGELTVFAEPGTPNLPGVRWIQRPQPLGAFANWKASLTQLYQESDGMDVIMLVQDDVIFSHNARAYAESLLWPDNAGVLSLYCSAKYGAITAHNGIAKIDPGPTFWGACALAFPREIVGEVLMSDAINSLTGAKIDNRVGKFCREKGKSLWVCSPSVAQHTGEFRSTLNHGGGGGMAASSFQGEDQSLFAATSQQDPVDIVMPLYGAGDLAVRSIECLSRIKEPFHFYVVDDWGPRDDVDAVHAALDKAPFKWTFLQNDANKGFTHSINRVMSQGNRHILILNSDAYVTDNLLRALVAHLESNLAIGAIGPLEFRIDAVAPHQDIRHTPLKYYAKDLPHGYREVASSLAGHVQFSPRRKLSYFCTLIRRDAIEDVGLLDERLPSGFAADDLHCDRLIAAGWQIGVAFNTLAVHEGSASWKRAGINKKRVQNEALQVYRGIR